MPISRLAKLTAVAVLLFVGLFFLLRLFQPARFQPYTKTDLMQDYIAARAIRDGLSPYLPMSELGPRYSITVRLPDVPTPHPPPFELLVLPMCLISYGTAAVGWLLVSLTCLLLAIRLLWQRGWPESVFLALVAVSWYPVQADLSIGQVMCAELFLLAAAWHTLRKNRQLTGGLLLGLAVSVKLITWPLIILLIIERKWRAALASASTIALTNGIAAAVLGPRIVFGFYAEVGARVAAIYRADSFNFSIANLGSRIFVGTRGEMSRVMHTDPLVWWPQLSQPFSLGLMLAVVVTAFYMVFKMKNFDRSFAVLVALSLAVSPTTWWYYSTLLLIPMAQLAQLRGWRAKLTLAAAVLTPYAPQLVAPLFGVSVSFWPGLLLMTPLLGALAVSLHLSTRLDQYSVIHPKLANT